METSPLRAEQFHCTDFATPSRISRAVSGNVRRKQRVQLQFALKRLVKNLEPGVDQKHWPLRISQYVLNNLVTPTALGVCQMIKENVMAGVFYAMKQISLFLVAKCLAVADEKFKIARIRLIDPRKINFINDAMAEGEPEAAASGICSSKTFLCAGRPTRLNSGRPKRRAIDLSVHGDTSVLETQCASV
jgi:hypothetical protein